MAAKSASSAALPRALPGFESIRRYRTAAGISTARILPGEYYVTREDEAIDTVLGSCVAACIRNPRFSIGGMNHFMLPRPIGSGSDAWEKVAGRATRFPVERADGSLPTLAEAEARLVSAALAESEGNKNEAARRLGIDRQRLYRKISKYGLGG